jgi:hypothetical protein
MAKVLHYSKFRAVDKITNDSDQVTEFTDCLHIGHLRSHGSERHHFFARSAVPHATAELYISGCKGQAFVRYV